MPPKKRKQVNDSPSVTETAKTTEERWKTVRGRRGGLKAMLNMPMDIIKEICLLLHPRDLLNLSRASKSFHAFFMAKSSAYLWKGCLRTIVGLPPCPETLIEPAWVSLVFVPVCTVCRKHKAPSVHWEFLARFCAPCRKQMLFSKNEGHSYLWNWRFGTRFIDIPEDIFITAQVTGYDEPCYLRSQISSVYDKWEGFYNFQHRDAAEALAEDHRQQTIRSKAFAALCKEWDDNEQRKRTEERERLIFKRTIDVFTRLGDLGWQAELDFIRERQYAPLLDHKRVKVAKMLTEQTWQNMKDEMIECMEHIREERLEHEYMGILAERWPVLESVATEFLDRYLGEHPEMLDYRMNIADLALSKEFRDVMCAPADEVVDQASFLALEGQMDAIVDSWRTRVCKDFRRVLAKHKAKRRRGVDPLDLATTLFVVDNSEPGRISMFFPNIVAHSDLRSATQANGTDTYEKFVYGQEDVRCYFAPDALRPWALTDSIREVIRACGKDPSTATAADLDASDVRLVGDDEAVTTWRGAKSKRTKASAPASRVTAKTEARWKNVRGRRGGLQDMLNMPMDVMKEICLYLHPRDLLSLSRTSKSFHAFLIQRSSAYLWKGTIKNILDLPPCPEGWIESAWISLIFSPYCTLSGTALGELHHLSDVGKAATVHWEFLSRFCARCRPQMVVAENKVNQILSSEQWQDFYSIPKDIFLKAMTVTGFKGPCYSKAQVFEAVETYGKLYAARKWDSARKLGDQDSK
ncbi:uncharacterized protein B0H18DRAFT_1124560 [Fomitopsis serialis]|uniref:uncharacterized protein n=1 Tax=Fomitopsis serialis TaxID=139415 RepID=UPI002007516A|nr:uncharacterized protein B0H18DRAFT_1124560 [Neoantrodia serialis]KAH9915878.1 hypothetical protein B0H18DRAFT_1124560 [Neoantrodia serialis]